MTEENKHVVVTAPYGAWIVALVIFLILYTILMINYGMRIGMSHAQSKIIIENYHGSEGVLYDDMFYVEPAKKKKSKR